MLFTCNVYHVVSPFLNFFYNFSLRFVLFAIWLLCAPIVWAFSRISCCAESVREEPTSPPPTPSGEVENEYADPVYPGSQVVFIDIGILSCTVVPILGLLSGCEHLNYFVLRYFVHKSAV